MLSLDDRDALTRVAVAEAANQGDSGVAAVVQTILNRLAAGGWGATVEAVVNAPHQFEPVARAGGTWRRLPDFIGGALYFQNPKIVASRIASGSAPANRLNFSGRMPVAVIGDHAFYAGRGPKARPEPVLSIAPISIAKTASPFDAPLSPDRPAPNASGAGQPPPERGMFILADGRLIEDLARPRVDH